MSIFNEISDVVRKYQVSNFDSVNVNETILYYTKGKIWAVKAYKDRTGYPLQQCKSVIESSLPVQAYVSPPLETGLFTQDEWQQVVCGRFHDVVTKYGMNAVRDKLRGTKVFPFFLEYAEYKGV